MGACGAFFSLRILVLKCMRTSRWWCASCANVNLFVWYLPGTACLYSEPSPVDLACLRNHLLHACRCYWYRGWHQQDDAVGRDITHYSFSNIRAVVCGFSSNMRSKLVSLRRNITLVFICIFHAYSYDTYILVVRCVNQNKDTVWSVVLLLVTGVCADPKYSYSYICMTSCVRTWGLLLLVFNWKISFFQSVPNSR